MPNSELLCQSHPSDNSFTISKLGLRFGWLFLVLHLFGATFHSSNKTNNCSNAHRLSTHLLSVNKGCTLLKQRCGKVNRPRLPLPQRRFLLISRLRLARVFRRRGRRDNRAFRGRPYNFRWDRSASADSRESLDCCEIRAGCAFLLVLFS